MPIAPSRKNLEDWDGPTCLHFLADHTSAPNHFRMRAYDWANEVERFAAHEQRDPAEWEEEALEELRTAITPFLQVGSVVRHVPR